MLFRSLQFAEHLKANSGTIDEVFIQQAKNLLETGPVPATSAGVAEILTKIWPNLWKILDAAESLSSMILLRTHSRYSFHRATASLEQLVAAAVTEGMSHLALTDYFALYGVVQFAQLCKSRGVQPIIGMMACIRGAVTGRPGVVTLLAKNRLGYKSLCELSTIHQTEKETQGGGINWGRFSQSSEGLICIVCEDGGLQDESDRKSVV